VRGHGEGLVCEDLFEAGSKGSSPDEIVRVIWGLAHLLPRGSQVRTGHQGGGRDPVGARFGTCGRASLASACRDPSISKLEAGSELVRTKLEDPQFEAAELLRIITVEIATVATTMRSLGFTRKEEHIRSCLAKQMEVLRQVAREVMNEEVINFDGPKFKFMMDRVFSVFRKAMQAAGVDEGQRSNIMRHLRDLMGENKAQLRRETAALGKKSKAQTAC